MLSCLIVGETTETIILIQPLKQAKAKGKATNGYNPVSIRQLHKHASVDSTSTEFAAIKHTITHAGIDALKLNHSAYT